jgi:predicted AAA+ superfamily ATPase
MDYILRPTLEQAIQEGLKHSPIVVLQGPRQCGKTTLARDLGVQESHYFAMDDSLDIIRLEENARTTLASLNGLIVIDEAQKKPDLFPTLRVLADRREHTARFLLLGSASTLLMKEVSETLAGRAHIIDMSGFSLGEVGAGNWRNLWIQGAFPQAFMRKEVQSMKWRMDYIREFIQRDLRDLSESKISNKQIRDLLRFIATTQGGNWNHSTAANNIGVDQKTVKRYLELFRTTFIIRELPLYATNIGKTLRRAPKYFIRDSGITHALMQVFNFDELIATQYLGASWESYALEQVCIALELTEDECYTWGVQSGAEIDLVFRKRGKLYGIEFKHNEAPRTTRSFTEAVKHLKLEQAWIVHSGPNSYSLKENADAVSIQELYKITEYLNISK